MSDQQPQAAFEQETIWLRRFMEFTGGDVFFPVEVDVALRSARRSRPEIVGLLKVGIVTYSEKSDGGLGWVWFVDGADCDGKACRLVLEVETNVYRVEINEVIWG